MNRNVAADGDDVFQLLGEFRLVRRQQAFVVRFADRILVLAESGRGVQKLTEITQPEDVKRICAVCADSPRGRNAISPFAERKLRDAVAGDQMSFTTASRFA